MEGISDILRVPLGYIIRLCYSITQNYLVALLLFVAVAIGKINRKGKYSR